LFHSQGGTYNLAFIDLHWATSEHFINGQKLNMEAQLHHYNSWFQSYEEALEHEGGTMAVAVLMKVKFSLLMYQKFLYSLHKNNLIGRYCWW